MKPKAAPRSPKAQTSQERPLETTAIADAKPKIDPIETARYIADFTAELSYLARKAEFDLLAYLLDMARLEAVRGLQASRRKS